MSERQIRDILRDVCADLDRHSRRVVREGVRKIVIPTVLGAGLVMTGCESVQLYGVPDANPPEAGTRDSGSDVKKQEAGSELGPLDVFPYMAPDAGPDKAKADTAPPPPDGLPVPPYMAPDWMAGPPDGVPVPPYMAPDSKAQSPDAGAQPPYMAPPFPDKGTP